MATKQTAANNDLLAAVKRDMNAGIYKMAANLLNTDGEKAALDYLNTHFTAPKTREDWTNPKPRRPQAPRRTVDMELAEQIAEAEKDYENALHRIIREAEEARGYWTGETQLALGRNENKYVSSLQHNVGAFATDLTRAAGRLEALRETARRVRFMKEISEAYGESLDQFNASALAQVAGKEAGR